jgi:hypothetical protein
MPRVKKSVKVDDAPTVQEAPAAPSAKPKADLKAKSDVLDMENNIRHNELWLQEFTQQHAYAIKSGSSLLHIENALCEVETTAARIHKQRVMLEMFKAGYDWE